MALTLMYITNNPEVAKVAEKAGVDRIWIDMEYIGKEERQAGMNTVKSHHTVADIKNIRPVIKKSELLVRVNPIYDGSKQEIDDTIAAGADVIMLPMFKTVDEVEMFFEYVNGRIKTILLVETAEAVDQIEDILRINDVDEIHIGLNDLHLAYGKKFMFELLTDGTVERISKVLREKNIKFGFGGIARVGYGELPAERIMAEHYRLGSTMAILSRSFCNANTTLNAHEIEQIFIDGVKGIREKEFEIAGFTAAEFEENKNIVAEKVAAIVKSKS